MVHLSELRSMWNQKTAMMVLPLLFLSFHAALGVDVSQLVRGLPGQPSVAFKHYAGHIVINSTAGRGLFYWFFEADHPKASTLPLVLWLNGGPGCSSVGVGALTEIGPFLKDNTATGLLLNPYAWNKAANMIFLEVPYNTGFSYTNLYSDNGFYTDKQTAADSLSFMLEFLSKFSEYKNNGFYIAGESFAGHYIPTLASQIVAHNKKDHLMHINMKGFLIGNPSTDDKYDIPGDLETLFTHSTISKEVYEQQKKYCNGDSEEALNICSNSSSEILTMTQYIDRYNIYKPSCSQADVSPPLKNLAAEERHFELKRRAYDPCVNAVTPYLNLPKVQAALNVANRPVRWRLCNSGISLRNYASADILRSMLPVYRKIFKTRQRILIYSGDLDTVVSTLSTRGWIRVLNMTIVKPWYAWNYTDQVGGWAEIYEHMTFTTVRGSGHMVPKDTPAQALFMFRTFLAGKQLPGFT